MDNILATGTRAYWDTFAGLVPVLVLSIKSRSPQDTRPSSDHEVTARVTRNHGPYRKGETVSGWSLHFVPPAALIRRTYDMRIGAYAVKADT